MVDDLPTVAAAGVDVFEAVVDVEDFGAAQPGAVFDRGVNLFVRFHGALFERINVAVEVGEEREGPADVRDRQFVGGGEKIEPAAIISPCAWTTWRRGGSICKVSES
jgi:hypothetical protein